MSAAATAVAAGALTSNFNAGKAVIRSFETAAGMEYSSRMLAVASLHALDLNVTTSCRECKSDEAHCVRMPPSFEVKAHAQFQTEQNFRYVEMSNWEGIYA